MDRPYLTLYDHDTLEPLSSTKDGDGRVYDLYNTTITQTINGEHNATFNILPYLDVWRIGSPNLVELDGELFQIARLEKTRSDTLEMRVDLEHISYRMNNSELAFEEDENPELEYFGYAEVILAEMLQDTWGYFSIHEDLDIYQFMDEITFTTSQKGVRNRILELAATCEVEAVFSGYSVNFVPRVGADNGVTLEVGKNIRGLTEVTMTTATGDLAKSYEVDTLDLHHIVEDEQPLEMYDIRIGDTLEVIDEQFGIDIVDRVYSISYDPFKKALPQIVLANQIPSTANTTSINTGIVVGGGGGRGKGLKNVYLEGERNEEYPNMQWVIDEETGEDFEEQRAVGIIGSFDVFIDGNSRQFPVKKGKTYSGFIQVMFHATPEISMSYEHSTTVKIYRNSYAPEMVSLSDHSHYQYKNTVFEDTVKGVNPAHYGKPESFTIVPFSFYATEDSHISIDVDYWRNTGTDYYHATEFITGLIQFEDDNAGGGGGGNGGGNDNGINMEYGKIELREMGDLYFENGPYAEIKSVTTGLDGSNESTHVTIRVEELRDESGYYTGLRVHAADSSERVTVNVQAICAIASYEEN